MTRNCAMKPLKPTDSNSRTSNSYVVKPLQKAIDVLKCVGQLPEPMSLKEISLSVGLPKATVFRYLRTFELAGIIAHDATRRLYHLDTRFMGMINLGDAVQRLREVCLPHMLELQQFSHETVSLGVIDASDVVYLEIVEPSYSIRFHARVGGRDPISTTSLGKAILAHMSPEAQAAALPRALRRRTPRSMTDLKLLMAELDQVKVQGFAEDNGENEEGAMAIGAPLFNASGAVVAAISVAAPAFRVSDDRRTKIIPRLIETAKGISADLGFKERLTPE